MTYVLHFMGVHEEDALALVPYEVEGAGGAASHYSHALRPLQNLLQLRHISAVHLRMHRQLVRDSRDWHIAQSKEAGSSPAAAACMRSSPAGMQAAVARIMHS